MTSSKQSQKQETRAKILHSASSMIFKGGIRSTSVAKLMKQAGLTVGGFYAHFQTKDALVRECFSRMLGQVTKSLRALPDSSPQEKSKAFYAMYLSKTHRDKPETGCPVPAMIFEATQMDESFRSFFAQELEQTLEERIKILGYPPTQKTKEKLLVNFATLLGAQLLARATKGSQISDTVLDATEEKLLELLK